MYNKRIIEWMLHFILIILIFRVKVFICETNQHTKYHVDTSELIGYCAPYHGKVCKSYITTGQVWYSNVSDDVKEIL